MVEIGRDNNFCFFDVEPYVSQQSFLCLVAFFGIVTGATIWLGLKVVYFTSRAQMHNHNIVIGIDALKEHQCSSQGKLLWLKIILYFSSPQSG